MQCCMVFMDNYTSIKYNCNRYTSCNFHGLFGISQDMNIQIGNDDNFYKNNLKN